jgi:DUF1680 family protein
MKRWTMPSGALVSQEAVDAPANPWKVGYEYCAMFEQEFACMKAGQYTGDARHFDDAEHLWFNAMQGSREPDGSAILYCSDENRLSVHDEHGGRERFTPTGQHIAVCCNPNSTRVAAYFISNAWMKPTGTEPALAAMLYGPCEVKTEIAGTSLRMEELTGCPYSGDVQIKLIPSKPVAFCLWLRNPSWSKDTKIVSASADIRRVGDFWQLRKRWKAGDIVSISFDRTIREVPAINGEVALQYGPLLYVLPVKGETKTVKTYKKSCLKDYYVSADPNVMTEFSLPSGTRDHGFGFRPTTVAGANPEFPLVNPPVVLEGTLLGKDNLPMPVTLVPMGTKSTELRRVTFPVR